MIYESTVYPGATEEVCVPILAAESGLTFNKDFFVGYSPERINPATRSTGCPTSSKSRPAPLRSVADDIDVLYRSIITAAPQGPVHPPRGRGPPRSSNTQRDVNVALINELAMLFGQLGIDTHDVLAAAGTRGTSSTSRPAW